MSEMNPKISILIPVYDEAESLHELHARISEAVCSLPKPVEQLYIDDGSSDGSIDVLRQLHDKDPQVRIVRFRKNYGKSAALAMGFREARGDVIITIDADLQDEPAEIPNLLAQLDKGFDLVSGWKQKRNDPFIKRTTSKLFNRVTCILTGLKLHDINCGLKAYRRGVVENIKVYGELHRYLPVLAQWGGFKVGEVVVQHHARKYGRTKFGLWRFAAGIFDLITVLFITRFTKRPLHLFGFIGFVAFFCGLLVSVYLTYERLMLKKYLSNRPLLFLGILLLIVGVQFVSIGLLGEMITENRKNELDYSVMERIG
jgi:glycosyltransferase involved in cell wall biosynthesis